MIDLTGITNENEFYSHHYLSAIIENDLKGLFKKWRDEEKESDKKSPASLLRGMTGAYFLFRSQFLKDKTDEGRLELQQKFFREFFSALGYGLSPAVRVTENGEHIPIASEKRRGDGAPELWVLSTYSPSEEETNPLIIRPAEVQYPEGAEVSKDLLEMSWEHVLGKHIFNLTEPPRWVILHSDTEVVLVDRGKWNEKRLLRFDLPDILGRRELFTIQAMAALLHRDSLVPEDGLSLLDTLDENAHKHAYGVSDDLKYALREAIELIGNEAIRYIQETRHEKIYEQGQKYAEKLSIECLRYMYRLLFLFYIEARPELGYAPMKSEAYRTAYSLESLRDLELVQLNSDESRNGYFIHNSLNLLFSLVYKGFTPEPQMKLGLAQRPHHRIFEMTPLHSHLFDPERTPILSGVKFRNSVLQRVIELMSLTSERSASKGRGRRKKRTRRGRVSYAQLGINQLGAVYEALLSYRGFFAETDLYEVKKAGETHDVLQTAYFVKEEDLTKYKEGEKVYDEDGNLMKYPRGTFIYRLAGRDREKSASYYTPEVLTKCLVKYALKELLKGKTADDILRLTICEPAMGSAAFLNEAINQLSEAYLTLKQRERGESIPHDEYAHELQKTKMFLADRNVYGVDLNKVAVELAEVSLWLNTIHEGADVPWFGLQLRTGNSLIGTCRNVFDSALLKSASKKKSSWLDEVPTRVEPGASRDGTSVYHFLLPDRGMSDYTDRVVRKMAEEELKRFKDWKKAIAKPYAASDIRQLQVLSGAIDKLWRIHTETLSQIREQTEDEYEVYGQPKTDLSKSPLSTEQKDEIREDKLYTTGKNASAYRRLRLVMDYWCALWFWPIKRTELLPTREDWLREVSLILMGKSFEGGLAPGESKDLFYDDTPQQQAIKFEDEFGFIDLDGLIKSNERLTLVQELAQKYRFHHWELEFADVFQKRGGFDLVLGNPPWIKVEWNEGGVMGDHEPLFVLGKYSAPQLARLRGEALEEAGLAEAYLGAYEEAEGSQNFLNALQNYPILRGMQSNLYKCFLPRAWMVGSDPGVSAFLHPEGVYDDPKGGSFRREIYERLRYHFQFQNELMLFADIHDAKTYGVNVYTSTGGKPSFVTISNLFSPSAISLSEEHDGRGTVPGIKDEHGRWAVNGHRDRIVRVTEDELALFARLYDPEGTPALEARLPVLHASTLLSVLEKFAAQPKRLGDLEGEYKATVMWDETNAVKKDHTIRRETRFPKEAYEWILSGPHFYIGNPFYKTPRAVCNSNQAYDVLDLTELPEDYLPRTNYVPDCSPEEYMRRTPKVPWDEQKPVTEYYRLVNREMLSQAGERTFVTTIIPPRSGHVNTSLGFAFRDARQSLTICTGGLSIPVDFRVKSTGMGHANTTLVGQIPVLGDGSSLAPAHLRTLCLLSLTDEYKELWLVCWESGARRETWTKPDLRIPNSFFQSLTPEWNRNCALRTDYSRRQALVEIDVLVSMALGLTLEELITIYRVQFPVMRQYEADTWYDQKGRIVYTCSKGLPGVGFSRSEWEEIRDMKEGTVSRIITDDTLPGGPRERTITYYAPFDKCDREEDYRIAWEAFTERGIGSDQ